MSPSAPAPVPASGAIAASTPDAKTPRTGWLRTEGNQILTPEGRRFAGRGANIHDTRSCDACAWEPPRVDEVLRRIDVLVDDWHASFVRLLLESYAGDGAHEGHRRLHYRDLLDDDAYFRDLMRILGHIGKKPGVYVLVSLWHDPSLSPLGWPTERTKLVWAKLAHALRDMPFVLFGLVNEPESNEDGKLDEAVWNAMNDTTLAIRAAETPEHRHIVVVQGTRMWSRSLEYYIGHPIAAGGGANVAYETHVYDDASRFDEMVRAPAAKLPVIVGEFGIVEGRMTAADCTALMDLAERLEVPWLAYTFHTNCPPNLLVEHRGTCAAGVPLEPSAWGRTIKERLARPSARW